LAVDPRCAVAPPNRARAAVGCGGERPADNRGRWQDHGIDVSKEPGSAADYSEARGTSEQDRKEAEFLPTIRRRFSRMRAG
jgi:hypothetical protein